jgi:hypothetical protein
VPDDPEYDTARQVCKGAIDRRLSCIIHCAEAEEVSHAVRIAAVQAERCGAMWIARLRSDTWEPAS